MNVDQAASGANPEDNAAVALESLAAAPPPSKKETSLREFLGKMDEYAPIVSAIYHLYLCVPQCTPWLSVAYPQG